MIPDSLAQSVRLPVRFRDGKWELLTGGPLPAIKDGTVGDIEIAAHRITDGRVREALTEWHAAPLLTAGSEVFVHIDNRRGDPRAASLDIPDPPSSTAPAYVPVHLKEDLFLRWRPSLRPTLAVCWVHIPALPEATPNSLNEAYTLISEEFEPHRRSHTGNVFKKVFVRGADASISTGSEWFPLGFLRKQAIKSFEEKYWAQLRELIEDTEPPTPEESI